MLVVWSFPPSWVSSFRLSVRPPTFLISFLLFSFLPLSFHSSLHYFLPLVLPSILPYTLNCNISVLEYGVDIRDVTIGILVQPYGRLHALSSPALRPMWQSERRRYCQEVRMCCIRCHVWPSRPVLVQRPVLCTTWLFQIDWRIAQDGWRGGAGVATRR